MLLLLLLLRYNPFSGRAQEYIWPRHTTFWLQRCRQLLCLCNDTHEHEEQAVMQPCLFSPEYFQLQKAEEVSVVVDNVSAYLKLQVSTLDTPGCDSSA